MILETTPVAFRRPAAVREDERVLAYTDQLIHSWLGTLTALGVTLVPLFFVLDLFSVPPALLPRFAAARALATGYCALVWLVVRRTRPTRWSSAYGYGFSIVVGGAIVWMTVQLGGFDSGYYAGLNLVIASVTLLLPWRPIHAALNGALVVAGYVAANALPGAPFQLPLLLGNLFFMASTVVIAVTISAARYDLIRKEFHVRSAMLDANALLDTSREQLKAARDALWGEMEVAKRIQTALLPGDRRAGRYEVAARMIPAAEVGGDYYDIIAPPGARPWIAVGDVSGHGVESGLVMMMTQTAILSLVRQAPAAPPSGVFRAVNGVLCENVARLGGNRYMTLNVVRLDDEGLTLAGRHQDVLVWRRATGGVEAIANVGCWLGVVGDVADRSPDSTIPLAAGDAALFYTDGVTEARSATGAMYGEERLADAFARAVALPPAEAIGAILGEVGEFSQEQDDDRTLVLVRRAEA